MPLDRTFERRLAGLIKLATAIISWATVIALVPLAPKVLGMRTPEELEAIKQKYATKGHIFDAPALIADKAFDSNDIIADLNGRGAKVVISQHPRRAIPRQLLTGIVSYGFAPGA